MKTISKIILLASLTIFAACSNDDDDTPELINDGEVVTTAVITLTPSAGGQPIIFSSRDLDGDGPTPPEVTSGNLAANTTYSGAVTLTNELESPAEDITEEIKREDEDHQLFFQVTGQANTTVAYTDEDEDGNPLGLAFTLTTGGASNGELTVILRHLLDKNAPGVADGNIENAGGETELNVVFPLTIE